MKDLLHFSSSPLASVKSEKQTLRRIDKPEGLWVSVGEAWAEWCVEEGFGLDRLAHVSRVQLADDARILRLSGVWDLDRFTDEYAADAPHRHGDGIQWSRVAESYDGIIIAPYCWDRRLDLMWYYGWDVASGCIWNADAIAGIEALELAALPSTGAETAE